MRRTLLDLQRYILAQEKPTLEKTLIYLKTKYTHENPKDYEYFILEKINQKKQLESEIN